MVRSVFWLYNSYVEFAQFKITNSSREPVQNQDHTSQDHFCSTISTSFPLETCPSYAHDEEARRRLLSVK